jgi:hypothetical protein
MLPRRQSGGGSLSQTNIFQGLDKMNEVVEFVHSGPLQGKAVIVVDQEQLKRKRAQTRKYLSW